MTRKLFAEISLRAPVTPICWNQLGRFYQHLGSLERDLLTRPFEIRARATGRPEMGAQNVISELKRLVALQRFDFAKTLGAADVFLSPDLHHDGRRRALPRLLKNNPARSVAIFHDAASLRLKSVHRQSRERFYRGYIESLAGFDLAICVSEEAQEDLRHYWEKYGCGTTATCVEPWPGEFEGATEALNNKADSDLILYVSSFQGRKNHLGLLRAAEELWQQGLKFELHLIGRNVGGSFNRIVRQIRKLRRRGRSLCWLRHVNEQTLLSAYRNCRFTVYPSLMEGFGLPIVESLAHGKPCVCGGNGALGEVARGGGCLIVDQTREDSLAAGIKKLLTDQDTYARLCTEARARKFRSWADYMERLFEHLRYPSKGGEIPVVCP